MRNLFFTDIVTIALTVLSTAAALLGTYFTFKNHKKSKQEKSGNAPSDSKTIR